MDLNEWGRAYTDRMMRCLTAPAAPVIGWFASESHRDDAKLVDEALKQVLDNSNATVCITGSIPPESLPILCAAHKDRVTFCGWVNIYDLPNHVGSFDVGIAPVVDDPFNWCKSNLKALQFGVLGIPCVASDRPPYSDDADMPILRAKDVVSDWVEAILPLVTDAQKRHMLGMELRQHVERRYDASRNFSSLVSVFKNVLK